MAVVGIGTEVGKTVVAAILVQALQGDYWKPIQCGHLDKSDSMTVRQWVSHPDFHIFPEAFRLQAPVSPHHASRLENIEISPALLVPPKTKNPLIIEGAGGVLVPLNKETLLIDVIASWKIPCILVSRHYLGSINHTLLTIEALKNRKMDILGIVFNGPSSADTEEIIENLTYCPILGRLDPEPVINSSTIKKYAEQWKPLIKKFIA